MGSTPVCTIDATGIRKPSFAECLSYFEARFRAIYGQDVYIAPDSQDGQWIGILATALDDANAMAVSVFNSFSPAKGQGEGLSSLVKINGMRRKIASYSQADVIVVGQAGAVLTGCKVYDKGGNLWSLPDLTIPFEGQATVTATCDVLGAIAAPAGALAQIATPTFGWQSITNPEAATPGEPVEPDSDLRQRQSVSTMLSASYVLQSVRGGLEAIGGVSRMRLYENDTAVADLNGIPGHTIACIVDGGDAEQVARVIAGKKGGCGTVGDTIIDVLGDFDVPTRVAFFRPADVPVTYRVTVRPAARGYTANVAKAIKDTLSAWTAARGIGEPVPLDAAYAPAKLNGGAGAETYRILSLEIARDGSVPTAAGVDIAFNEAAQCLPDYVTIVEAA